MNYKSIINELDESKYLISMTPIDQIVKIGYDAGMNTSSHVLDLCCGYGEMLKIWHEVFGICGIGVDICSEFIDNGKQLLAEKQIDRIQLVKADVLKWDTNEKFDFACLSGEEFGGLQNTISLLERFIKPEGKLIIGTRFSQVEDPPAELVDFEGELLSLNMINRIFQSNGYFITAMASDTHQEWERYIMWSARRHLEQLRRDVTNQEQLDWCQKWYDIYFRLRRQFEGYATFVIEKI